MSDPALHDALNDLWRQNIAIDCEELEPGLLVLALGEHALARGTPLAYFVGQLYTAYYQTAGWRSRTVIQLRYRGEDISDYVSDGLSMRDLR